MDTRTISMEDFARYDGQEPVLLVGEPLAAFFGSHRGDDALLSWQRELHHRYTDHEIGYRYRRSDGVRLPCRSTLGQVLEWLDDPRPPPGVMAMDELVISQDESLRPTSPSFLSEDFLEELFPPEWKPPKFCLVLGTAGGRSGLHTDPFGWTGWNICLRGHKLWRFIEPGPSADIALHVESPARVNLAAHAESPVDLYADGQLLSEDGISIEPDVAMTMRPDATRWPSVASANIVREVLQGPGEIIVFPASWWHQTLHLTPTLAIASQYVNQCSARGVLDRLLRVAQLDETKAPALQVQEGKCWRKLPWSEQVRRVLDALEEDGWKLRRRHGPASQPDGATV